jgi:hypothetical protein
VRLLPLGLLLVLLATACGSAGRVRQPSSHERARIIAGVRDVWEYESEVGHYGWRQLDLKPAPLRPVVVSIRVARSDPRYASAVAELRDARGRRHPGTAVIVLRREDDPRYVKVVPEWWAVEGAATVFPPSCTGATPQALRDLLCPDRWSVLGYPRPRIQPQAAYAIRIRSTDLHALDWENVTLPGAACGSTHPIPLRESQALVRSTIWPWWPLVDVSAYPLQPSATSTGTSETRPR